MLSAIDKLNKKNIIAAIIFIFLGIYLSTVVPSVEVAWVSAILILTIYLFAFEIVPVDVAAVTIMVILGLTGLLFSYMGLSAPLVDPKNLFNGFSGNAVMSIVAVMIIGSGLDKTGLMSKVASFILKIGGSTEKRVIPIISGTVGIISSFMQNVGAAALFLPVVSRISARTGLPMSRLLMPMGFTAILGGTVTMVGSSPLILLNDLILTSNQALPAAKQMATFSIFSVTPIGLALVGTGILYFVLAGRFVLPSNKTEELSQNKSTMSYFQTVYNLDYEIYEIMVPAESNIIGKSLEDIEHDYKVRVVAVRRGSDDLRIGAGGIARDTGIEAGTVLGVIGSQYALQKFTDAFSLTLKKDLETFTESLSAAKAGVAEIVIPPGSELINKSAVDLWMRKTYGLALLAIHRGGETIREGDGVRDMPLLAGDTLVCHVTWDALARLEKNKNFVVVTTEYPHEEEVRPHKLGFALLFFSIALGLVLFSDLRLSIALLVGAMGMVLSGVLSMDEAYEAVSWKTVFLLASLIPLGFAVESSGTAAWIAEATLKILGDVPTWVLQAVIAILATFFTLVMSNVGATVLLVPLAVNIAIGAGANPAVFALTVAIATSNSFLIPTHQVNALIMGPGGYRVPDFMKAGGIMTILFLIVSLSMLNIVF
ncbi:MAG: SLC13 family permease [Gammaproteobacteria bacterium]|nr:SLC13 family permease [Gammaproteobacteria bacterium]